MSSSLTSKLSVVLTSLSLGLVFMVSAASADVGWVIQPSSVLGGAATIHLAAYDLNNPTNPDPNSEGYVPPIEIKSVPATDPGTSGDPALGAKAVNSLIGSGAGTFKTFGNTITSSLDFGKGPAKATEADLTIKATNVGNFYPSTLISPDPGAAQDPVFVNGQPVYNFGTLGPVNNAAKLETQSPLTGYNALTGEDFSKASLDNGRIATYGLKSLPHSDAAIGVTPALVGSSTLGTFDAKQLKFFGTVGVAFTVAVAADPNGFEGVTPQSLVLSPAAIGVNNVTNDLAPAAAVGTITRGGVGVNTGPDYIMTAPFSTNIVLSENADGTDQLSIQLTISLVAKANIVQGDTNFDGVVDIQDITQMANKWLTTDVTHLGAGDANGDGVVDIQDITMAANHWLQTSPPLGGGGGASVSAVPEPSSLLLIGFGAVSMLFVARRRARS